MKALGVLLLCSGCSQLFGLDKPVSGGATDAAVDSRGDGPGPIDGPAPDVVTMPRCPQDNFDDGVIAPAWTVQNAMGVSESGGVLHTAATTNAPTGLKRTVDATDADVDIEVVQFSASGAMETYFGVAFDSSNTAGMALLGGAIAIQTKNNGTATNSNTAFNAGAQYWRIHYDATTHMVTYSVRAAAASSFTPVVTHATSPVSATQASASIGTASLAASAGESQFDNFLVTRADCTP